MADLSPEDQPDLEFVPAAPDEVPPEYGMPFEEPAGTVNLFLIGLDDPIGNRPALLQLTTPESHDAWGDFTETAQRIAEYGEFSFSSRGERPVPDVAYIPILVDWDHSTGHKVVAADGAIVSAVAVLTVVNRPAHGGWLVHAIGRQVPPEQLPRG